MNLSAKILADNQILSLSRANKKRDNYIEIRLLEKSATNTSTMIPAIDVPAASRSRTVSVSNYHIKEEENEQFDEDDENELMMENMLEMNAQTNQDLIPKLIEKSVIVHRDENGFGFRVKGQSPVFVEHVHENGAAWRAGVRQMDRISKVNGVPVAGANHKEVVLMLKSCTRFVGLTLLSCDTTMFECDTNDCGQMRYLNNDSNNLGSTYALSTPPISMQNLIGSVPFAPSGFSQRLSSTVTLSCDHRSQNSSINSSNTTSSNNSSMTRQHRLMLGRLQHPHYYHHSFSTADNRHSNHLTKLRLPANSNNNGLSLNSSPTTERQTPYNRQHHHQSGALARRSESVTHRPSYLSSHHHNHQNMMSRQKQESIKESIVCLNCRTLARRTTPDLVGCVQCQLNLANSCYTENNNLIPQTDNLHLNERSRSFGNQRDPRQQEQSLQDVYNKRNLSANESPTRQMPKFKLTQSDSMSSLNQKEPTRSGDGQLISGQTATIPSIVLNKQPSVNKRLEIIREFIDTEKTHTDRLRCLDELFYRPLKSGGFMTAEQLRMVFSCHRTLYKIHRQIYRTLLSSNHNLYTEPMIGSALLEIFEGDLKRRLERAACSFCAAQSTNVDLLNKLTRRDTKVGEFIAQVTSQQMIGRLGIKDLLASCFQRLTKYPLLLENLLKATPQSLAAVASLPGGGKRHHSRNQNRSFNSTKLGNSVDDELESNRFQDDEDDDECDNADAKREQGGDDDDEEEDEAIRNSRRMLAISLAEEREFIGRALNQSRQILIRVNDSVKVAMSHNKLKEIWKRTDKYPGVPLIDITKQQVVHEGLLTLRLSKRSFDVYVLLLNDYLIILTREGQDKYRLKFFTPDGKSSGITSSPNVYSPVFVIDEHLTTRDAATDENGFYLLCKRKDDSRIYEFASRSPAERLKWRDRIQWTIERQMSKTDRRGSCESTITKSSSELSAKQESDIASTPKLAPKSTIPPETNEPNANIDIKHDKQPSPPQQTKDKQPTKIEGTISYVEDDGIVMPSNIGSSTVLVDQAIQVTILDTSRNPVPPN